jgi:hypothetical protein
MKAYLPFVGGLVLTVGFSGLAYYFARHGQAIAAGLTVAVLIAGLAYFATR